MLYLDDIYSLNFTQIIDKLVRMKISSHLTFTTSWNIPSEKPLVPQPDVKRWEVVALV